MKSFILNFSIICWKKVNIFQYTPNVINYSPTNFQHSTIQQNIIHFFKKHFPIQKSYFTQNAKSPILEGHSIKL